VNVWSIDGSEKILSEIAKPTKRLKSSVFQKFRSSNAVTAGLNHCLSDLAVLLMPIVQDPPELIPAMIDTLEKNNAQVFIV
jgi:hypothetical protein